MLSVDEIVHEFRELSHIPFPESGRLHCSTEDPNQDTLIVNTTWSQRDVIRGEKLSLTKSVFLTACNLASLGSSPFVVQEARLWDVVSPGDAGLRAVCIKKKKLEGAAGAGKEEFFVQVWRDHELVKTIDVSAMEKHGVVYPNDGVFGGFEWSYHEGHLLYVAEKFVPKQKSYFQKTSSPTADDDGDEANTLPSTSVDQGGPGHQYDFLESWGEQLTHAKSPVLCVLDVDSETLSVLDNVPPGVSPGQPVWCPDDAGVVFVGWYGEPIKLGLTYCAQRPSAVYHIDFATAVCHTVGHERRAVSSVRFSPNGRQAVWLEQDAGGPHQQCRRLICCQWRTKEIRVVIDVVDKAGDGFPGINTLSLAPRCWCSDNRRLVVNSIWRSRVELLLIDTDLKLGRMLSTGLTVGTATLLDLDEEDRILARLSSPSRPHYLALAKVPQVGKEDSVEWIPIKIGNRIDVNTMSDIAWTILHHTPTKEHEEYGAQVYESILVGPSETAALLPNKDGSPLVVFPHGGPHTAFSAEFSVYVAGLVMCGFAVLQINYRGSLGFGQDSIRSLLGHVGENDVADCYQATQEALTNEMFKLDPSRVVLLGGSHGGFLVGHLSARHPLYRVTVCRNPVMNIAQMVGSSDIPDWCWVEVGLLGSYAGTGVAGPEVLTRMFQASPMAHVDGVVSPTLIVIGERDLRVPTKQGLEWYHALKARGVPTRMLVYPDDGHPIISVPAESDCFVNIVRWYQHHLTSAGKAAVPPMPPPQSQLLLAPSQLTNVPSIPNIAALITEDAAAAVDTASDTSCTLTE